MATVTLNLHVTSANKATRRQILNTHIPVVTDDDAPYQIIEKALDKDEEMTINAHAALLVISASASVDILYPTEDEGVFQDPVSIKGLLVITGPGGLLKVRNSEHESGVELKVIVN